MGIFKFGDQLLQMLSRIAEHYAVDVVGRSCKDDFRAVATMRSVIKAGSREVQTGPQGSLLALHLKNKSCFF